MTNFQSKHVALLKNKKDCAEVYCVTLIEFQAHCDAFIQNIKFSISVLNIRTVLHSKATNCTIINVMQQLMCV